MIPYEQLISERKTPFYVFDERGFIENYKNLRDSMRKVYSEYALSYSYKTNYTPFICLLVKELGGYAEVVSDMEYLLAKKLGYENKNIVYNGPAKGVYLKEHLLLGGIVNIDNLDEAAYISSIAKANPQKKIKVGLRINVDVGGNFISRFGLEPDSQDFHSTLKLLKDSGVCVVGLHCHISRCRGLEAWKKRAEIMLEVADKYICGIPEYISLGSGMFADMDDSLKKQFESVPAYADYAEAVMRPFAQHYKDKKPLVFTEPGTTVVARYLNFVSSVINIKNVRGRNIATMDGSFQNLGEICTMKKLPLRKIKETEGKKFDSIDLMGYTCLEQDLMYPEYTGEMSVGDVVAFENVGGYSVVSKPQFIHPNCPMIAYRTDGTVREIMREETFDDVFGKFVFEVE